MKKLPLLLIVGCISATISCKKEAVTTDKVSNTVSSKSVTSNQLVATGTHFGVCIPGSLNADSKIKVCNSLGVNCIRTTIILKDFKGKYPSMDKYLNNGFKILLNLNYAQVVNNKPNPFPKNMVEYRKLLENVLDKYKPEVAVIENEPTTKQFHSGPIEDYISMLKIAIDVCHQYNVKVADGSIHPTYILQVMNDSKLFGNAIDVKKLIEAYKTLKLDYVNVHTQGSGNSYPAGQLKSVADYLRNTTGKEVMSNEFHLETNSTSLMKSFVKEWQAGNYVYAVVYSSGSGKNIPVSNGTTLTSVGVAYRDAIK